MGLDGGGDGVHPVEASADAVGLDLVHQTNEVALRGVLPGLYALVDGVRDARHDVSHAPGVGAADFEEGLEAFLALRPLPRTEHDLECPPSFRHSVSFASS